MEDPDPRTIFAAERTLLAWVRTVLALVGFGFLIAKFGAWFREMAYVQGRAVPRVTGVSVNVGVGFILFGVLVATLALLQHRTTMKRILANEPIRPSPMGMIVTGFTAASGLGLAVYLFLDLSD